MAKKIRIEIKGGFHNSSPTTILVDPTAMTRSIAWSGREVWVARLTPGQHRRLSRYFCPWHDCLCASYREAEARTEEGHEPVFVKYR